MEHVEILSQMIAEDVFRKLRGPVERIDPNAGSPVLRKAMEQVVKPPLPEPTGEQLAAFEAALWNSFSRKPQVHVNAQP